MPPSSGTAITPLGSMYTCSCAPVRYVPSITTSASRERRVDVALLDVDVLEHDVRLLGIQQRRAPARIRCRRAPRATARDPRAPAAGSARPNDESPAPRGTADRSSMSAMTFLPGMSRWSTTVNPDSSNARRTARTRPRGIVGPDRAPPDHSGKREVVRVDRRAGRLSDPVLPRDVASDRAFTLVRHHARMRRPRPADQGRSTRVCRRDRCALHPRPRFGFSIPRRPAKKQRPSGSRSVAG